MVVYDSYSLYNFEMEFITRDIYIIKLMIILHQTSFSLETYLKETQETLSLQQNYPTKHKNAK